MIYLVKLASERTQKSISPRVLFNNDFMVLETFKILVNLKLIILIHSKWIELQNKMICYNAFWTSAATTFHTFIMNNLLIHSIGLKLNYFLVHAPNIIHLSILVQPFFFSRLLLMFLSTVVENYEAGIKILLQPFTIHLMVFIFTL